MKQYIIFGLVTMICFYSSPLRAEDIPVQGRIESVSLFKNGLAVIRHALSVDKSGDYILEDVANDPVHGTFWIESDVAIKVRATYKEIEKSTLNPDRLNFQQGLAGQEVEIHFKEPGQVPLKGVIEPMDAKNHWDQNYQPRPYYDYYYRNYGYGQSMPYSAFHVVVRTAEGLSFVDISTISFLNVLSAKTSVKMRKPVLIFSVGELKQAPATIAISYLAKGLSWAPAYRIDLLDNAELAIEQSGVIKNEFADIDGAEMNLITGFPQIKFAHVTSPLALNTSLSLFFAQLSQPPVATTGLASNMVQQQAISVNEPVRVSGLDLSSPPQGEGVDLYYRSIGKTTLKEGDALFTSLAKAKTAYERIVEWIVPDTRSPDGRPVQEYERQQNPDKYHDAAWDAISFKNPFDFPMTTATASIYSQGKFNGQTQSNWVNSGETDVVYITKALSIKTSFSEQEVPGERNQVRLGGNSFQKITVTGELFIHNNRAQSVNMRVRRQFSGDFITASDSPEVILREEGVYSVNKRNELKWNFALQPGEEKKIAYSYTVFTPY